jgi:hypothetical protein
MHQNDADPDLNFHADPHAEPTPSYTHVGKSEFFFFSHSFDTLQCFISLIIVEDVTFLSILDSILKFCRTEYRSTLFHLHDIDTYPDPDPQHCL